MNPKENPDENEIGTANPDAAGIKNAKNNDTVIISLKNTVAAPKNRTKWQNVSVRKVRIRTNAFRLESKLEKSNSYVRMARRPGKRSSWYENVAARKIIGAKKISIIFYKKLKNKTKLFKKILSFFDIIDTNHSGLKFGKNAIDGSWSLKG